MVLFLRYLGNPAASHVQLDLSEYLEIVGGSEFAKEGLGEWIDVVSKPYYTGKRHLFSRKSKVDKAWRRLINDLPSPIKRAEDYANLMFGWKEDLERAIQSRP